VPRHALETHGEDWTDVRNIVTNGPFRLESWQRGQSLVLVRNPSYHGRFRGNLQRVEMPVTEDGSATMEMYESDALDVIDLMEISPLVADRARQRYAGEYVSSPSLFTGYIGFDITRPPFDNVQVRRAFALATDREKMAIEASRGFLFPATGGFVPRGVPGHVPGIGLPYDPERARKLLAEAGYPGGQGFPVVTALLPSLYGFFGQHQLAQWQAVLGVEGCLELLEWTEFLDRLRTEPPRVFGLALAVSSPDPDTFLRVGFPWRTTGWRNETYGELVETARRTLDQQERMRLYEQAERILVEELPIVPTTYGRSHLLIKPWVKRYPTSALSGTFWKDVVIEPR
jgi:ABC-type oligopeptide transport system substrate-binding subunit